MTSSKNTAANRGNNGIVVNRIALGIMLLLAIFTVTGMVSLAQKKAEDRQTVLKELRARAEIGETILLAEGEKLQIVSSVVEELTGKFNRFLDYNKIQEITLMLQEISAKQDIDIVLFLNEERQLLTTSSFTDFSMDSAVYQTLSQTPVESDGLYNLPTSLIRDFGLPLPIDYGSSYVTSLKSSSPIIDDVGDTVGYVILLKLLSSNEVWVAMFSEILNTDFAFFDDRQRVLFSSFSRFDVPYPSEQHLQLSGKSYTTQATSHYDSEDLLLGELVIMKDDSAYTAAQRQEFLKIIMPILLTLVIFIASIIDSTKRRQAEAELAEYHLHLEKMVRKRTRQLETANRELKEFAYIVSHDLKAPLRAISQLSTWIAEDYSDILDESGKEQLDLLLNRVKRMHSLIEGILQYSRIGRVRESIVEIKVSELLTELVHFIAIPDNIKVDIPPDLPVLWAEKTRISQLFQNLLSNSMKFNDKNEGLILITATEKGGFYHFTVSDNGPGIDEEYFDKIFQIFQSLAPRDEFESTGIGLSLVKKIVELYGGKVWVESTLGQGAAFHFTLSRKRVGPKAKSLKERS
ncbi:MAG: ATP-binding protein [Thermodesulfobacteriota bacterium]